MLLKLVVGGLVGAASSLAYEPRRPAYVQCATVPTFSPPTLELIMDPNKDTHTMRAVVVGGGYSGAKMAYQMDSMFEVTLIDEKNYYELSNDIIPIIGNKWEEEKHTEACRRMLMLHRYYLKRTNVVTGTVNGVDSGTVYLRDGRKVPYDLLFVATGEQKPFPFQTRQRTITGRVQELRHFNHFLQSCRKVAVVGGGPVGTSLAYELAADRPELQVHLYHSRQELLPSLPPMCGTAARERMAQWPNLHLHLSTRVTGVSALAADGRPAGAAVAAEAPPAGWARLLQWAKRLVTPAPPPIATYGLDYERLQCEKRRPRSVLGQIYFGKENNAERAAPGVVEGVGAEDGFDYVFAVTGDTPRPIVAGLGKPNILKEHEMPDGHYRASTLNQLFDRPNMFAVGRCTNFPVVRGYGTSDVQVRGLLRALMQVLGNDNVTSIDPAAFGVDLERMRLPRLHVRMGNDFAVGCTPWSGGMVGTSAYIEFMQDRNYLMKEFQKPTFFKAQDPAKVSQKMRNWLSNEVTDVVYFSHS